MVPERIVATPALALLCASIIHVCTGKIAIAIANATKLSQNPTVSAVTEKLDQVGSHVR